MRLHKEAWGRNGSSRTNTIVLLDVDIAEDTRSQIGVGGGMHSLEDPAIVMLNELVGQASRPIPEHWANDTLSTNIASQWEKSKSINPSREMRAYLEELARVLTNLLASRDEPESFDEYRINVVPHSRQMISANLVQRDRRINRLILDEID